MQFLTSFFTAFCVASVLIGALYIVCPDGQIAKSVRFVLSIVFLVIIIAAANITVKNIDIDFTANQASPENYEEMQIAAAEYVYSYTLQKENINFSQITVCTDKSENDSIVITKVIIYSNAERKKITEALGVLAEVREVEVINE